MFSMFGKIFKGRNDQIRDKVVAYTSDGALQDKLVKYTTALTGDLIVGDVIDVSTGAPATLISQELAVVVEPAFGGDKSVIIANPVHTILKKSGLVTTLPLNDVVEKLQEGGHTFADFDTVALRTT